MASSSLAVAALVSLLSGQSASDRAAYREYQVQLARIMATEPSPAVRSVSLSDTSAGGCILVPGAGNAATTRDCTRCHAGLEGAHSHPVDVEQDGARARSLGGSGPSLRPASEVVKRGVFLADGKVTCLTCHDGDSRWKYKLALPPDAQLKEPVKPGDPTTYDPARMAPSRLIGFNATTGRAALPAGTAVSPTPLCKVCHSFD